MDTITEDKISLIKGDYRSKICGCIPTWVRTEIVDLLRRSLPLVLALVLQLMFNITVMVFVGRLGDIELAGIGLAITVLSFTQNGMAQGMSTACDTLFSQAYGANQKKLIGIHLQRSLMYALPLAFLIWSLYLVVEPGAVLIGIDQNVAEITAEFLLYYMPGLLCNIIFQILSKYLIAQYIVTQVTWMTVGGNIVNIGGHLLLVTYLQMGIRGSAIALSIASASLLIMMLVYIFTTRVYTDTWSGWSLEAFSEWGMYSRYALPGMAMISLEYIGYEMGAIMAGMIGPKNLASMSVYSQIGPFLFTTYHAFGTSCSFRVGAKLGSDDVEGAVRATKVTYFTAFVLSIAAMVFLFLFKHQIPQIFTNDEDVINMAEQMFLISAFFTSACALSTQQCGVLRGCGRQVVGACIHVVGYLVLMVPIGGCLMFLTELKAVGFLWGLFAGMWTETLILTILLWFMNWDEQAKKARAMVGGYLPGGASSISLLGSRLALPKAASGNLANPETKGLIEDISLEYGTIPKPNLNSETAPRRRCDLVLIVKRTSVFVVVLLILAAAIAQKIETEKNRDSSNFPMTNETLTRSF